MLRCPTYVKSATNSSASTLIPSNQWSYSCDFRSCFTNRTQQWRPHVLILETSRCSCFLLGLALILFMNSKNFMLSFNNVLSVWKPNAIESKKDRVLSLCRIKQVQCRCVRPDMCAVNKIKHALKPGGRKVDSLY